MFCVVPKAVVIWELRGTGSAANAMTRACLTEKRSIEGPRTGALILEGEFVSIDTEWDIALVEFILERRARGEA